MPTCAATSPATRSADRNAASQTTNTPSGKCADEAEATASANAVFPTPPGPVTVVNEEEATISAISASSRSLPTSRRERPAPTIGAGLTACAACPEVAVTLGVSHGPPMDLRVSDPKLTAHHNPAAGLTGFGEQHLRLGCNTSGSSFAVGDDGDSGCGGRA